MVKMLYWHLTAKEVSATQYPVDKLMHWEVRCGFSEESYFSLYWFKVGVPYDKEPINGVALYTVECTKEIASGLEEFLSNTLGGKIIKKSFRTFFSGAKIELDNKFISDLAGKIITKFNAGGEIWLEFDGLTDEESKTLFPSKSLLIAN